MKLLLLLVPYTTHDARRTTQRKSNFCFFFFSAGRTFRIFEFAYDANTARGERTNDRGPLAADAEDEKWRRDALPKSEKVEKKSAIRR